jgi:hypothetical protein
MDSPSVCAARVVRVGSECVWVAQIEKTKMNGRWFLSSVVCLLLPLQLEKEYVVELRLRETT